MPSINIALEAIPIMEPFRVESDGTAAVVIRTERGVFAYEDRCPHAFWPISAGEIERGILECPGHGWTFNVETGRCLNAPAYCLTQIPAVANGDLVRLEWEAKSPDSRRLAGAENCRSRPVPQST